MRNPDNNHHQDPIIDFIYDPVFPDPDTIGIFRT
ncbi:MAG: hypothetical protein JWO30_4171 [Fibrobacteres bacterium]|nr:hypothetical protein [Fibrobacterota bacterium]